MKHILISTAIFAASVFGAFAQEKTINAYYDGFAENDYYFTDEAGESLSFSDVVDNVKTEFSLDSEVNNGKYFEITYTTFIVKDEEGDEYENFKIVALKKVKPQKAKAEELELNDEDMDE